MQKRLLALLLCAVLCVTVVFSYAFILLESDHDCTHDHCQVCIDLQACHGLLRILAYAGVAVSAAVAVRALPLRACQRPSHLPRTNTPVSLKVKLLN